MTPGSVGPGCEAGLGLAAAGGAAAAVALLSPPLEARLGGRFSFPQREPTPNRASSGGESYNVQVKLHLVQHLIICRFRPRARFEKAADFCTSGCICFQCFSLFYSCPFGATLALFIFHFAGARSRAPNTAEVLRQAASAKSCQWRRPRDSSNSIHRIPTQCHE